MIHQTVYESSNVNQIQDECIVEFEYERIAATYEEKIADLIDENAEDPYDPVWAADDEDMGLISYR